VINPALILILGALVIPFMPRVLRQASLLALPIVAFFVILGIDEGSYHHIRLFDYTLETMRVDKLARVFCFIFLIASFLGNLYALYEDDRMQQVSGLVYAGSAVGAVLAGDLVTLFVYWELTAISDHPGRLRRFASGRRPPHRLRDWLHRVQPHRSRQPRR
jgi:multicomponent Na+:H+ antiporter subunit D